jgi:hypothetical protein
MSATQISEAISKYGRTLVPPDSDEWWPLVEITPVVEEPGKLHVAAPLWTAEEGRSDLTLELWLTEVVPLGDWAPEFGQLWRAALLDIHVI